MVSLCPLRVKLGDFGVSKRINEHTKLRTPVSTRSYSAPEILGALESSLETSEYTHAVDIWSLGCVMFEVLTGSTLFRMECFVWPFCYGKDGAMLEPLREAMSEEGGFEFVRRLLSPDPMGRPSAGEALDDPWLKVPKIRRAREGGGMPAYAAVRSQACIRELLLPIFPGLFPRAFRFNEPLENPLTQHLGPGNNRGGRPESVISHAGSHELPHVIPARGRNFHQAAAATNQGHRGHSRLQLRTALKTSPEEPPAAQFGFLFAPDLGLLLVHGAFRLIFRSLLPRGKGRGSRFADLSTLGALVFYFSTAALRGIGKGGVGHVGGKSRESGSKRRRLNGGRQTANTQLREGSSSLNRSLMPTTHDAQQTKLTAKEGAGTKAAKPSSHHDPYINRGIGPLSSTYVPLSLPQNFHANPREDKHHKKSFLSP